MAEQQSTSQHPVFQPRTDKADPATAYLLWKIANKTFIKPSGCWFYSRPRNEGGYGILEIAGSLHRVHRLIYECCVATIPDALLVLHTCDNPPCCRPDHLYVGDHADNERDLMLRGTLPGAVLTLEQVQEVRRLEAGSYRRQYGRLAEKFGVSRDAIWEIVRGKTWRHVE